MKKNAILRALLIAAVASMMTFALAGCGGSSGGDKAASGNNGNSKSDAILLDLTNSEFYDADATTDKTRGDFVHKIPGSTYGICVEKNTVTVDGEKTPSYRTILELNNDKNTKALINNANLGVHGDLYAYWVVKPEVTDLTTVIFSLGKSEAEAKTIVASFLPEKGYFYGWSEDGRLSLHKDDYTPIDGVASSFDGKILKVGDKSYELTSEYTIIAK